MDFQASNLAQLELSSAQLPTAPRCICGGIWLWPEIDGIVPGSSAMFG